MFSLSAMFRSLNSNVHEFLTKARWRRLLLTPCRSTFAARHSYAAAPRATQFRSKFDLTCQILAAAKIEQFIQTLGCF